MAAAGYHRVIPALRVLLAVIPCASLPAHERTPEAGTQTRPATLGERHTLGVESHAGGARVRAAAGLRRVRSRIPGRTTRHASGHCRRATRHGRPAIPRRRQAARHAPHDSGSRWFDRGRALLEVEAGISWPDLIRGYSSLQGGAQPNGAPMYGIRQKQTGADRLTIGGAVAANIHGRVLTAPPFVADVEALEVVTATGELVALQPHGAAGAFPARGRRLRIVWRGHGRDPAPGAARESRTLRGAAGYRWPHAALSSNASRTAISTATSSSRPSPHSPEFLRTGVLSSYQPADPDGRCRRSSDGFPKDDWNGC